MNLLVLLSCNSLKLLFEVTSIVLGPERVWYGYIPMHVARHWPAPCNQPKADKRFVVALTMASSRLSGVAQRMVYVVAHMCGYVH
jgi:hypothetical protein